MQQVYNLFGEAMSILLREVQIDLVQYTLGLSENQPAPCYTEIFKIYLCLIVLRKLTPSQPAPCYPKITTHAKTPTSYEIPTREMPVIPLS